MKYDFDKTASLSGSGCVKYDAREATFGRHDVIPMWIADMDFEVAPCISDAIIKRAELKCFGYGLHDDSYWNSYTGWLDRRGGWKVEREWLDFTSGVVAGFSYAVRAFSAEGDGVIIMPPIYPPFAAQIKANNRKVVHNRLIRGHERYEIDFEDLDRKLGQSHLLVLCNPHNPTGRVFSREELMRIGELCCKHDALIISDEIHSDLVFEPHRHLHIAALDSRFADRTITFIAPSKTFSVAGLSAAVAITPGKEMRGRLRRELEYYHIQQGNLFETAAIKAAYAHGGDWVDQARTYLDGNAEFACRFIEENIPQVKTFRPEGTYFLWLDCNGLGMAASELEKFMAMEAGVGLNSGGFSSFPDSGSDEESKVDNEGFGPGSEGFMRMNLGTSRSIVEKALNQIAAALKKRGL